MDTGDPLAVVRTMEDTDHLTDKLRRYIENISCGMGSFPAAKKAGYSSSYAKVIATRTKKNPVVAQAIERIRAEGMKMAVFDLAAAMEEAEDAAAFARQHKNPMAYVKATELHSKLSGLLIDRVEITTVDLTGALTAARTRVFPSAALKRENEEPAPPPLPAPDPATEPNGRTPSFE